MQLNDLLNLKNTVKNVQNHIRHKKPRHPNNNNCGKMQNVWLGDWKVNCKHLYKSVTINNKILERHKY